MKLDKEPDDTIVILFMAFGASILSFIVYYIIGSYIA